MEGGEEVKCYCLEGGFFFFFLSLGTTRLCCGPTGPLSHQKVVQCDLFVSTFLLRKLPTLILVAYRSTMLTACVFVTRDTVRHPRRFVFGKFVLKPNCSGSEAFVNRGLIVCIYIYIYKFTVLGSNKTVGSNPRKPSN